MHGSLLLVIWQSRCLCRCRIGLSDSCYVFDCSREPPPLDVEPGPSDAEPEPGPEPGPVPEPGLGLGLPLWNKFLSYVSNLALPDAFWSSENGALTSHHTGCVVAAAPPEAPSPMRTAPPTPSLPLSVSSILVEM
eukprot:COSAG02_NODE_12220_length_1578_cov_1.618661_1_plen_135_part_00